MPKDIITTVYTYDELDDKAKAKARAWYREGMEWDGETVTEDFLLVADKLGLRIDSFGKNDWAIFWQLAYSQGDGASFAGVWLTKPDIVSRVIDYAPKDTRLHAIARTLADVAQRNPEISIVVHSRDFGLSFEDYDLSDDDQSQFRGAMEHLQDWLYDQYREGYEADTSDEAIADAITANEYTFTSDGRRFG